MVRQVSASRSMWSAVVVGLGLLLCFAGSELPTAQAAKGKTKPAKKVAAKTKKVVKKAKAVKKSAKAAAKKAPAAKKVVKKAKVAKKAQAKKPSSRTVPAKFLPAKKAKAAKKAKKKAKKKAVTKGKKSIALKQWLTLGPAHAHLPVFHKQKYGKYTLTSFLKQRHMEIDRLWPKVGDKKTWFFSQSLKWKKGDGTLGKRSKKAKVAYLATYLDVSRYMELKLNLKSFHRMRVFLNGKVVANQMRCTPMKKRKARAKRKASKKSKKAKKSATKPSKKEKKAKSDNALLLRLTKLLEQQNKIIQQQAKTIARQSASMGRKAAKKPRKLRSQSARATLKLTAGVHLLVVKSLYDPKCRGNWGVKGSLKPSGTKRIPADTRATLKSTERHSMQFMLNRKRITGLSLSPNGREVLVRMRQTNSKGKTTRWLELRNVSDGKLKLSTQPYSGLYNVQWSPNGKYYSFLTFGRGKGTLWVVERATQRVKALFSGITRVNFHKWAPNSKFLIYGVYTRPRATANERAGAKRLRGMEDRWPWYRVKRYLYAVTVDGATTVRLTAGNDSFGSVVLHPNSNKLLFSQSVRDHSQRPFSKSSLFELDLKTMKVKTVLQNLRWFNGAMYSPDGKKLLIRGGPSLFGTLGYGPELPFDVLANQYETELYVYDLERREVECLTKTFAPTVRGSLVWHPLDGNIYFTALNKTRVQLFKYDVKSETISTIPTSVDMAGRVQFARNSSNIVYIGSGASVPGRLYTLDLWKPVPRMLYAPNKDWLERLHLGKIKSWTTHSLKGVRLQGRIYHPPGFNPRKKYPMIVYYYGGTFPITRYFDGRYPFHLWAAHGYVVYVLQPSGAVGFGQKHAARHVNEWGSTVADEIIHATGQMVATHPYVDAKRIGCIGASYGGFMTMYLVTRTQMFAAAVSHAGISNITSYWGAGFWGFLYSSIATAKQYPWSHTNFFVKQSPLYSAHKVKTPLLLLHGAVDTNVPPSESYQMYTALRLLRRPVELVIFKKENHWILQYRRRVIWTNTILAWFDRQLKKQPLWWKRLHGTRQH